MQACAVRTTNSNHPKQSALFWPHEFKGVWLGNLPNGNPVSLAYLCAQSRLQRELLHVLEISHVLVDGLPDDFGRFCTVFLFPLRIPFRLCLALLLLS
jgi:hypothetical protein